MPKSVAGAHESVLSMQALPLTRKTSRKTTSAVSTPGSRADIAHVVHNELNIIIGIAELLLDEINGRINEEQRSSLTEILTSARRLLVLLDSLVEASVPSRQE
ncbi:MAG: hypothetical protein N2506_06890 [Dehalococcoidales bacterium]|nr:hypothetical protein [Dehalococcoidales bacterium]